MMMMPQLRVCAGCRDLAPALVLHKRNRIGRPASLR